MVRHGAGRSCHFQETAQLRAGGMGRKLCLSVCLSIQLLFLQEVTAPRRSLSDRTPPGSLAPPYRLTHTGRNLRTVTLPPLPITSVVGFFSSPSSCRVYVLLSSTKSEKSQALTNSTPPSDGSSLTKPPFNGYGFPSGYGLLWKIFFFFLEAFFFSIKKIL